ncbi:MAG: hypothetical protein U9R60_05945 [Bacteroidota bacterium]|nr:hypothetical protein [Bacteroidota bacterium]
MVLPRGMYFGGSLILFVLFFLSNTSLAQKSLTASQTLIPLAIDGKIDSLLYHLPDSASHFIQMEPDMGQPSSAKTIAYLMYDARFIYFAAFCFQDPSGIVSKITARDNLSDDDDVITLILDTYDDNRTGFGFAVNPLGTLTDFRIGDDGRSLDLNWDEVWQGES